VQPDRPITYGIVKPGGNVEGGVPVIKVKDFPDGSIDESDLLYASPAIEAKYARSRLNPGDLLFSIRGSVGRMAFVPDSLAGANLTQDTARLSLREELDPEYVRGILQLPEVGDWIRHHIKGVAVQGVNLRDLRALEVPILPKDKQKSLGRFVASVDKSKFRLGTCDAML
jgi:type I restriction enzyme, S subunit